MESVWVVAFQDADNTPSVLPDIFDDLDGALEEVVEFKELGIDAVVVQIVLDPLFPIVGKQAVESAMTANYKTCLNCQQTLGLVEYAGSPIEGICARCASSIE